MEQLNNILNSYITKLRDEYSNAITGGSATAELSFRPALDEFLVQISEYIKYGFEVVGIIGANRSPNCGVDTTSDNNAEVNGNGLFMEKISSRLSEKNISIPMIGLKGTDNISDKLHLLLKGV